VGSSSTQTLLFDVAYAPFGETYASSGSPDLAFTSQRQDTVSGVYDFPAREYSNFGRWPSPDPSGLAAAHLPDPQTLNRYAYVRNNPLAQTDPTGLDGDDDGDSGVDKSGDDGNGPTGCTGSAFRLVGSSHRGRSRAADDCGGGGGTGGGISGDPTSGGDPTNSGDDCDPSDPSCGGVIDDSGNPPVGQEADTPLQDTSNAAGMVLTDDSNGSPVWMNVSGIPTLELEVGSYADDVLQDLSPGILQGCRGTQRPVAASCFLGRSSGCRDVYLFWALWMHSSGPYWGRTERNSQPTPKRARPAANSTQPRR
jgi:RHS repeat-associated protein